MFIWKIILKIIAILNSEETPWQVGLGFSLGAVIGLTPLFSPHNLLILLIIMICNVSFRSAVLGLTIMFIPGFIISPLSNKLGASLLIDSQGLIPFWTGFFDMPLMAFSKLNNTYTLGSLIISLLLFIPLTIATRYFVIRYRLDLKDKIAETKWFKAISKSKIFVWGKKVYDLLGMDANG